MSEIYTIGQVSLTETRPTHIVFYCDGQQALTITRGGITANPDIPVDDIARAVFNALEGHIRALRSTEENADGQEGKA